ncbi:MAG: prefoldin subunit [Candidatus Nanoarchaeia archaeon]|nr:prefoldin subunit [Candidatus Nanoarchaeia archaeon]MDD5740877.1 prefoldin subunit [Candidatus Nanoarchaeia archaeon]
MEIDEKTQSKIQEIQILEQNLHNLLLQKQAFQIELNETENALSEIEKTKEDVFRIISNIMIKTDKNKLKEELDRKKQLLNLRLKSIDSQENEFSKHLENLRKEIMKKFKQ